MQIIQYDMFVKRGPVEADEAYEIRQELQHLIATTGNVRRGLFARLNDQSKLLKQAFDEIAYLREELVKRA